MAQNIAGSGWFSTPNRIFESGLSTFEIVVLTYLHRRSGPDGSSWPSVARIAADCQMSDRSVQRTLQRLKEGGWIRLLERKNDSGAWSTYIFELNGVTHSRGGDTQSPGVVSESHQGGDTQSPKGLSREGLPFEGNPLEGSPTISDTSKFIPPTLEDCEKYFAEHRGSAASAAAFFNHFDNRATKKWHTSGGRGPLMSDWKRAASDWIARDLNRNGQVSEAPKTRRATQADRDLANR